MVRFRFNLLRSSWWSSLYLLLAHLSRLLTLVGLLWKEENQASEVEKGVLYTVALMLIFRTFHRNLSCYVEPWFPSLLPMSFHKDRFFQWLDLIKIVVSTLWQTVGLARDWFSAAVLSPCHPLQDPELSGDSAMANMIDTLFKWLKPVRLIAGWSHTFQVLQIIAAFSPQNKVNTGRYVPGSPVCWLPTASILSLY